MTATIRIKRSVTPNAKPTTLGDGEIALNRADGMIFYANPTGEIVEFQGKAGPTGPAGTPGVPGKQGDTGAPGAQGEPGKQGDTGLTQYEDAVKNHGFVGTEQEWFDQMFDTWIGKPDANIDINGGTF